MIHGKGQSGIPSFFAFQCLSAKLKTYVLWCGQLQSRTVRGAPGKLLKDHQEAAVHLDKKNAFLDKSKHARKGT